MAENLDIIISIIKKYLKIIKKNNIKIEKVYLFGSYAKGNASINSDIDIAIISSDFKGVRFDDRRLLVPLRRGIDTRIEPMPYRPEDFNLCDPLVVEIKSNGIILN